MSRELILNSSWKYAPFTQPPCSVSSTFLLLAPSGRPSKNEASASPVPAALAGFCVGVEVNDSEALYMGECVLLVAKTRPHLESVPAHNFRKAAPKSPIVGVPDRILDGLLCASEISGDVHAGNEWALPALKVTHEIGRNTQLDQLICKTGRCPGTLLPV